MSTAVGASFNIVLGNSRGRPDPVEDTLLSEHPTARALEELTRVRATLRGRDSDPEFALSTLRRLQEHAHPTPLEARLRADLASWGRDRACGYIPNFWLQTLLADACLRSPSVSEHLVGVYTPDQYGRSSDRYVHLWPRGHEHDRPQELEEIRLACGRRVPSEDIRRLLRGKWSAPASSTWNSDGWRCPSCEDVLRPPRPMSLPSNLRQTIINLSNAAQLQAFGPGDHEHLIYRIDGEMRERRRHVSALPYHAQTRWRALTKQALGRALKGEINEFEVSARARSLIIAYDLAVDEAHRFQSGWLRRLGVTLTPSTAERMPLLTRADVSEILINFLPRAYRDASTHLVPDDYELWAQWLKSPEYAQVHALAPSAAATRLKTRSREWRQRLVRTLGARTQ